MALETADRLDIQDLLSRYCIAMDTDDRRTFRELMAPDGEWIALTAQFRTEEEYAGYIASPHEPLVGRHMVSSVLIDDDPAAPGTASVRADVVWLRPGDDSAASGEIAFIGGYRCVVHKVEGEWRFKRFEMRKQDVIYMSPFFRSMLG